MGNLHLSLNRLEIKAEKKLCSSSKTNSHSATSINIIFKNRHHTVGCCHHHCLTTPQRAGRSIPPGCLCGCSCSPCLSVAQVIQTKGKECEITEEERLSEWKKRTPEDQRQKRGEFCHLKWRKQKPVGRNWVAPVEGGWRCEEKNKMKVNVREDKRCVRQTDVTSGRGELKPVRPHSYLVGREDLNSKQKRQEKARRTF